jgi:transposase
VQNASIIGIDLAKRAFQLHGAAADGSMVFRRKLTREKLLVFLERHPKCLVAMEACATSHFWGRELTKLGHEVKLIPPVYVKPYVKRQKNDAADAEAIAEAASRPTMRFVAVKTEEQQAQGMAFRVRDLFVRQRTQMINALRGHLAEYGVIAPQGVVYVARLVEVIEDSDSALPSPVRELAQMLTKQIAELQGKIDVLEKEIRVRATRDANAARLRTMPGIGPICAMAIQAFAPPMESFQTGRDFAAWAGLVPRQNSTGGKQFLGKTSKMGQRDIRRLLISGATVVVRRAARKGAPEGSWLARMMARKPRMLVATSLANRMARAIWAMMTKHENYRIPTTA